MILRAFNKKNDKNKVKDLYMSAFPADERFPFRLMIRKASHGKGDFWIFEENGQFTGMAYVVCDADMAYLFYLAICDGRRGCGYGTKALSLLKEKYSGKRLFLALETLDEDADNYEQRLKRHSFYEKCGLTDFPYRIKEAKVIYSIMGIGEPIQPHEYKHMMDNYMGRLRRHLVDVRFVE